MSQTKAQSERAACTPLIAKRDELMGALQSAQNKLNQAESNHDARATIVAEQVIKDARAALMEVCAGLEEQVEAVAKGYVAEWAGDQKRILKDSVPLRAAVDEAQAKLSDAQKNLAVEMERVRPSLEAVDAERAEADRWAGDTIRSTREVVSRLAYYGGK
jgi:hypothetical protein